MDGSEVARWIEQTRFRPTRGDAYDMGDVDRLLDELQAAALRDTPLEDVVTGGTLRKVGLREGYDRQEVDEFVARVVGGLGPSSDRPLLGEDAQALVRSIEEVRFTPSRLRQGYDLGDVDRLLDLCAQAARAGEPLGPVVDAAQIRTTRLRVGYDMVEVDTYLASLVHDH